MNEEELIEAGYQRACKLDEIGSPMPKRVEVEGRGVLLCREGEKIHAVDEICPHENKSMRFGVVFDGAITCPHHQYRFKLEDGRTRRRCAPLQLYEARIHDEHVWVKL